MRVWLVPLILVMALTAAFFAWPTQHEVHALTVQRGRAVDAVVGPLQVVAARDVIIKAEVPGRVASIEFSSGSAGLDVVKAESIAELDATILDKEIAVAKAEAQSAQDRSKMASNYDLGLSQMRRDMNDAEQSASFDPAAAQQLDKIKKEMQRAKISADDASTSKKEIEASSKAKLALMQAKRDKMTLKSPMDGCIIEAYVVPGDWVNVGDPIARVVSHEKWVAVSLDEADCQGIVSGQSTLIHFSGNPSEVFRGHVKALHPVADSQTRRRLAYVTLDLAPSSLVIGMTGQASIQRAERTEAILVPRRALWGDTVFLVQDGHLKIQPIQIGYRGLQYAEVLSGVKEGDLVLVDNLHQYHDGERVKIVN